MQIMTTLIEVKTSDLEGEALDFAVAKAIGVEVRVHPQSSIPEFVRYPAMSLLSGGRECGAWSPSSDWSQGGPMIAAHGIGIQKDSDSCWVATDEWHVAFEPFTADQDGQTPLIAACRVIVAAELGETVMVPKELMP